MAEGKAALPPPPIRRGASCYRAIEAPPFSRRRYGGGVGSSCDPQWRELPRRHFLDACSLCGVTLRASCDIFMYRGDTPFCSEECRQVQIELDEAGERETAGRRRRRWLHRPSGPSPVKPAAKPAMGTTAADAITAS